jgi:hypothetical protein
MSLCALSTPRWFFVAIESRSDRTDIRVSFERGRGAEEPFSMLSAFHPPTRGGQQ